MIRVSSAEIIAHLYTTGPGYRVTTSPSYLYITLGCILQVDHINIVHHFRPLSVCKLISIFKQNSILIKRIHEYTTAADAEAGSPRTME